MTQSNKFEQLLELLINEEHDRAQALFHEIVVEKSKDIYEGLIDSETAVEETKEVESNEDEANESVEIEEESIEEIGGDATDDLIADISADEKGDAEVGDEAGDEEDAGDEAGDTEDRVADLEDALDELKAEFEKIMSGEEGEEEVIPGEEEAEETALAPVGAQLPFEAKTEAKETVKEYKIPKSADNADKADNKKSPVSGNGGKKVGADAKNIAQGSAEEKGRPAPTAAKIIGDGATTGGKATVSLKAAPKADAADKADNKKSPVASK